MPAVKIAVHYRAQVRQAANAACEQVEVEEPCSVLELLARLADRHGEPLRKLLLDPDGRPQPTVLIFVGDQQVGPGERAELREGDVVTVLSPMAGG